MLTENIDQGKLKALSIVTRFNDIVGNSFILKNLYQYSATEWKRFESENGVSHLIKGVKSTSAKTDAIKVYISKLVALYMNSKGPNLATWSKETISGENDLTMAVINRIGTTLIESNEQLFEMVAVRLLGFDKALVELVYGHRSILPTDIDASQVVSYLATQYDDVEDGEKAKAYLDEVIFSLNKVDFVTERTVICQAAIDAIVNRTEFPVNGYEALSIGAKSVVEK